MGSEDFFILGDGPLQNAEEELVLSSLIDKKSEETVINNVDVANVSPESSQVANEVDDKPAEDTEAISVDVVEETEAVNGDVVEETEAVNDGVVEETEETEDPGETTIQLADQLDSEFEKLKSNEDCTSIVKTHLTDEIFEKLKNVNSDGGVALYDCIKSVFENPDSVLGIYATNLQFYDLFSDVFDPVIETYHRFGKEMVQPNSDWGDSQAFDPLNDEFVISVRINCVRNMQEYPVVCKMGEKDFNDSLAKVK